MARKKVVLVIVEGPSDDEALGIALKQVFDKESVHIHIMHGDITTKRGVNSQNIISRIGTEVKSYAKSQHYKSSDFKQIIHIVDTDGAYIPNENIIQQDDCLDLYYGNDGIYTNCKNPIELRNQQKRDALYRLRSCNFIWSIAYRVYYMSCNLDHVLHNNRNSSDAEKEKNAFEFAKKYKEHLYEFVKFICESSFSVTGDFKDSWMFIENNLNSLERYTNLAICISEEMDIKKQK